MEALRGFVSQPVERHPPSRRDGPFVEAAQWTALSLFQELDAQAAETVQVVLDGEGRMLNQVGGRLLEGER